MQVKSAVRWTLLSLLFPCPLLFSLQGCVAKGRYEAQVIESQTLSERLQNEKQKNAGLEKEVSDLKSRLETLESDLAEAKNAAAEQEQEFKDRLDILDQQLTLAKESKDKTVQQLKEDLIRMKGSSETANQAQQATIAQLQEELAAQNQEVARLKGALQITEEEATKKERELQEANKTREDLVGKLQKEISDGSVKISQLKNKLSVEIVDKILFPSGSDQITGEGKVVLKKVSDILKDVKDNNIRIEGHTDNVPVGSRLKDKFPSNWELSTSRATQVVRYLSDQGIDPEKLHAVGLSQYHPVTSNDTPEGKQRNRRIEIILFPKDIQEIAKGVE